MEQDRFDDLYEEWMEEPVGMRPKRIQRVRDEIMEATGEYIPRHVPEIENWMSVMQGTITKKFKKEAGEYSGGEEEDS